ncbi:MAG: hemolysin III family protein [Bacilli bacterium]|nr:hemolysin III family protein [Bacilli bacterium]
MSKIRIPKYSLGEELINSISHGIGALLSVGALIFLVLKAGNVRSIVSVSLYGSFMIILYTISCIYHALSPRIIGKKVLRVIDHCNVLLMVAGTYMPICLSLLYGALGWITFAIVWLITFIGVVFNAINVDKYNLISVICNLVLGWGALLLINPMLKVIPIKGIIYLILGGIMYTVGSILYGLGKKIPYMHSIFHFFVLLGSLFQFLFIYYYCI